MALEMEYLLSSDEMRSQRSTVLPPLPAMSSIAAPVEARDAGEGASPMVGRVENTFQQFQHFMAKSRWRTTSFGDAHVVEQLSESKPKIL